MALSILCVSKLANFPLICLADHADSDDYIAIAIAIAIAE
jgi:hypothetical protein